MDQPLWEKLAPHYSDFSVRDRLLLTGHSHQAWPDVAQAGLLESYRDAALLVDEKWTKAMAKAERIREALRVRLDDPDGEYTLAQSTHDVLVRFLSALPLKTRGKLVTTDSEFHSMRRQFERLQEEGMQVEWVAAEPSSSLPDRLADAIDDATAAVFVSLVFFNSGRIAGDLSGLAERCEEREVPLVVDTYHAAGVLDMSVRRQGLENAFLLGGGYKYLQWGEGNCFLRFPRDCTLRPAITGWFADFAGLENPVGSGPIGYSNGPDRFAGATYDPSSHYRAASVCDFFDEQGLTAPVLRRENQRQLSVLADVFDGLELPEMRIRRPRNYPIASLSGFLTLISPEAGRLRAALKEAGVMTDCRGDRLRFGPAPYLSDDQLVEAMEKLKKVL